MDIESSLIELLIKKTAISFLTNKGYNTITSVPNSFVYSGQDDNLKSIQVFCKIIKDDIDKKVIWSIDDYKKDLLISLKSSDTKIVRLDCTIDDNYDIISIEPVYLTS
jgi:hypothetical protein